MARTFVLTLLVCAFFAAPANAAWVQKERNLDWPPTTDFFLTSDPCAEGQCKLTARLTFRYKGRFVGRIPLTSPAQAAGPWNTRVFGHVETTNFAQYFWNCDSPGKHTWSAKIWATAQNAQGQTERVDHPAESGTWRQPGCSSGKPRRVSKSFAAKTAREKIGIRSRTVENVRCKRDSKKNFGRWSCAVRWTNEARTCTDTQSLFFYTRQIFHRQFNKVSSFRDSRRCQRG